MGLTGFLPSNILPNVQDHVARRKKGNAYLILSTYTGTYTICKPTGNMHLNPSTQVAETPRSGDCHFTLETCPEKPQ